MVVVVDISASAATAASPRGSLAADGHTKWSFEQEPSGTKEDYRQDSIYDLVRSRSGWLAVFFVGLLMAAVVIEHFEAMLRKHVELSFFVPLLIGHGGNTGSISNASVIRATALGQLRPSEHWLVLRKEAAAGAATGALLGTAVFLFCSLLPQFSGGVGLVVAISLPLVSTIANVLGGLLPLAALRVGLNPAVVSAPLMTTLVDCGGLLVYLSIAKMLLGVS